MRTKLPLLVLTILIPFTLAPLIISQVHASGCLTTCQFETDTNVPSTQATVWVRADGGTPYPMSHTFSFANGTYHTVEVMNTTLDVPSIGAHYVFKQWTYPGVNGPTQWGTTPQITTPNMVANWTSTTNGAFVAEFDKQVQLSLTFTDPSGNPVNPPSWLILQGSSTLNLTNYSSQWLSAGIWTAADAKWEGSSGMVLGIPTIDLRSGSLTTTVQLRAYKASILLTDNLNRPVTGAVVTVTFDANSTSRSFTSDSQGRVQLGYIPAGTYTAHIVFQNQDMGSYSVDATSNPTNTIKLGIGAQASGPVVSALVLLTIFGIAVFLLLLAIRVRKPPVPPTIT